MNDELSILADQLDGFLGQQVTHEVRLRAEVEGLLPDLWADCIAMGIAHPALPESLGGADLGVGGERVVLEAAGRAALPLPLVETMLAGALLGDAGRAPPTGPIAIVIDHAGQIDLRDGHLHGRAVRVTWALAAQSLVVFTNNHLFLVEPADITVAESADVAGEPCGDLIFNDTAPIWSAASKHDALAAQARGALMRAAQMAGAMATALDMSLRYVKERQQFGQPIGRFQAVAHPLAIAATQVAASRMAVIAAYEQLERTGLGEQFLFCAAMAKARVGEAAGIVAATAHQVHGAIGITREYSLHPFTRRLQAWRSDFGSEAYWQRIAGETVLRPGAGPLWPRLTAMTAF